MDANFFISNLLTLTITDQEIIGEAISKNRESNDRRWCLLSTMWRDLLPGDQEEIISLADSMWKHRNLKE
jgi:hypothetical protein